MMSPQISVAMSTHDDPRLSESIDSVLAQTFTDFELIVINDGCPRSQTAATLAAYAERDPRVHVIEQANGGLTLALVDACRRARAPYVARQDADDVSMPNRLARQVAAMQENPNAVLCVCGTRVTAPDGETIDEIAPIPSSGELTRMLREEMTGIPAHGCVMFRRDAYERVGGYRDMFYFAQDVDLWLRLAPVGSVVSVPEMLYELREGPNSISTVNRQYQRRFCELAQEVYKARCDSRLEDPMLSEARNLRAEVLARRTQQPSAKGNQSLMNRLIAARLCKRGEVRAARKYAWRALRGAPCSPPAWATWLSTLIG
jgi:glycosyltransferase involved in cell wall biosynthesis